MARRINVLFAVLSVRAPSACDPVRIVISEKSADTDALESLHNFVARRDEYAYLRYHEILWENYGKHKVAMDMLRRHSYLLRDGIVKLPEIDNFRLAAAVVKDMDMLLDGSVRPSRIYVRDTFVDLDYPSLYLLDATIRNGQGTRRGLYSFAEGVFRPLLAGKVVRWLRDCKADIFHVLHQPVNVFDSSSNVQLVYNSLFSPDADSLDIVSRLDYYALRRLKSVDTDGFISSHLILSKAAELKTWLASHASTVVDNKVSACNLFLVLREALPGDWIAPVPLSALIQLHRNMHKWLDEAVSPGHLRRPDVQFRISNEYSVESYLRDDLNFFPKLLREPLSVNNEQTKLVFRDENDVGALYRILTQLDSESLQDVLSGLDYHYLFKLQRVTDQPDAPAWMHDSLKKLCTLKFDEWLASGKHNVFDAKEHPLAYEGEITAGWNLFDAQSDVFFHDRGITQVIESISDRSNLQYLDYFSILLLKRAMPRNQFQSLVDDASLGPLRRFWYQWMDKAAPSILADPEKVRKLVRMLPLLPDAPISLPKIAEYLATHGKSLAAAGDHNDGIQRLFRSALQYSDTEMIRNMLMFDEDRISFVEALQALVSNDEFRDAIDRLDYNHLLILHHTVKQRFDPGGALESVLSTLLEGNHAYYRELFPNYVLDHLDSDYQATVSSMQYLPLLSLRSQATSRGRVLRDIDAAISDAKTQWLRWFNEHGSEVTTNERETLQLLRSLVMVPQDEYLLTPIQIAELGDKMRGWWREEESSSFRHSLLLYYRKFIEHAKKFFRLDKDKFPTKDDRTFRTHIWKREANVDRADALTIFLQFDKEIRTEHRRDVYKAISWKAVRRRWKSRSTSGDEWQPPNAREKYKNRLSRVVKGKYKFLALRKYKFLSLRKYKFLSLRKKRRGLPDAWFDLDPIALVDDKGKKRESN